MQPLKYHLSIITLSIFALSCGRSSGDASESTDTAIFDTVMPDTMRCEEDTVKKEIPVLKDTESILAAIEKSPDKGKYEAGIIPIMAKEVPEYAGKLLANEHEGFLIVDKGTMFLYRYDKYGVEQERVGIACAKKFGTKHQRRDSRTPEGFFTIEGIYDSTDWLYTDDDGNTSPVKGQFGPRFMRLKCPQTSQIGIHGTVSPWSIGGRRSHGCIRMLNENILRFAKICKPGWPVIVSPGPKDMAVNESEGVKIPSVTVIPGKPRAVPGKYVPNPEAMADARKQLEKNDSNATSRPDASKVSSDTIKTEHPVPSGVEENVKENTGEVKPEAQKEEASAGGSASQPETTESKD